MTSRFSGQDTMTDKMERSAFSPFYEDERKASYMWRVGDFDIVRCEDSGLVYLGNPPTEAALREFYSLNYFEGDASKRGYLSYASDEAVLRKNFRAHVERIVGDLRAEQYKLRALSLLDYGCAYGYFLDEANPHFRSVRGVEFNDEVAEVGKRRFGLEISTEQDAESKLPRESLDVVTMWDVIEHLLTPRSVLLSLGAALKSGGFIYITTGDIDSALARLLGARWRLINPPQHISYFSEDTLTRLLDECGFEIVYTSHCGKRVSLGLFFYVLNYLLGRKQREAGGLVRRLIRYSVYINLFDVSLVCARKR